MASNAENQKNPNNSVQGQNHNNDKNKKQTTNQKEQNKNQRNHTRNHKVNSTVKDVDEKDQLLEEQVSDQNKIIKNVEIKVSHENVPEDINRKEGSQKASESA
jgi:hypothetical protein